jgi:sugar transferase EpsL
MKKSWYESKNKRLFDLFISGLMIIVLSPVIFIISILILIFMGSPIFYCQERLGQSGKPFRLIKFRTMIPEENILGKELSEKERITNIGKILRKTSLDELPELYNVIKGDMSLVGPRPLLIRYLPYFNEEESRRFLAKPGITGLAQIMGRNELPWDKRIEKDLEYIEKSSFYLDLYIILKTILLVLTQRGVKVAPSSYMKDFDEERRHKKLLNRKDEG